MKTRKLLYLVACITIAFAACTPEDETQSSVADFESVKLGADSISIGTSFVSSNILFTGDPAQFWNGGIICSAKNDTVTAGYANQFSSMAGTGAFKSRHFGVVYAPAAFTFKDKDYIYYTIKSLMVTNSTYAYRDMKTGTPNVSKKFGAGDWFKLTITGYKSKVLKGGVDVYLADFRNGKADILKTWQKVDLSALGIVDSVALSFDSSDKGQWGVNTPSYVCIDNIEYTKQTSTPL